MPNVFIRNRAPSRATQQTMPYASIPHIYVHMACGCVLFPVLYQGTPSRLITDFDVQARLPPCHIQFSFRYAPDVVCEEHESKATNGLNPAYPFTYHQVFFSRCHLIATEAVLL